MFIMSPLKLLAVCLLLLLGHYSAANASPLLFTFGYLRMGSPDVDSPNSIAGFLATIQYANTYNYVPGVQFRMNVTTIPCWNNSDCTNLSAANNQILQNFLAAMPGYSAILKPNYIVAQTIIDEAKRLGGIPVLDADDIRMLTFETGADNVINFNHNWQRQAAHLFTYMQQTDRCVHSGILHGTNSSDVAFHVAGIRQLFTDGGFPAPTAIDVLSATDVQLAAFFSSEARCYIIIGTAFVLNTALERLYGMAYDFKSSSLYVVSTAAGEDFFVNGSTAPFQNMVFVDWSPFVVSHGLTKAFNEWLPNTADYVHLFAVGEPLPTTPRRYTFQAYMTMLYIFETIRDAVAREPNPNATSPLPLAWSKIVDSFYSGSRTIEGYRFNALSRTCPRTPMKQICFCNALTPTSYLFVANTTNGNQAITLVDEPYKGQRNIASLEIENSCGYYASSWSYPITGLALYPSVLMGTGMRKSDLDTYNVFQAVFGIMTAQINYAATAPTRALRYAAYDIQSNQNVQDALDTYIDTIKPFVIYGSMAGKIENPRGVLTLRSSLTGIETEDPVLTPHSQWRWDIAAIQPVLADYIHSLIAYYESQSADTFTSISAIASTQREAELISMSFATWGYDVPVSAVTVSADPSVWSNFVASWMGPGTGNPFIVAASASNNNSLIETASATAAPLGRGVLAIACSVVEAEATLEVVAFNANGRGDIIFAAFRSAWWTAAQYDATVSYLQQYASDPRFHLASQVLGVAQQLYSQVYYDYTTTAATILYQTSVISSSGTAFGPFSNTSCTAEEIALNSHDRTCQCAKGVRTVFVLSMRNYNDGVASDATDRFSWTMTTCGVVYTPYVPPTEARSNALSKGAIAGIAVGGTFAFLFVVGALIVNSLFFGRNNRSAPKDSSQPFAIVFTDIQSSTSLWARAPVAMSEAVDHHHELMRKALRRNGGYEVKTVGDSFMVAFKDPADATRFALDAQTILHTAEWHSELDAIYVELIAEAEAEATAMNENGDTSSQSHYHQSDADAKGLLKIPDTRSNSRSQSYSQQSESYQPVFKVRDTRLSNAAAPAPQSGNERHLPSVVITHAKNRSGSVAFTQQNGAQTQDRTTTIDEEWYGDASVWHGLRVRIGVHYGMGDIRKDPVSLGYDYYGTVVNTAARVEGVGHGGQTLLTDAAFDALPPGFAKSAKAVIVALGPQPLRGLDAPIKLFQMVPASLQGRHFPALRLHVEKDTEESSVTETTTATGTNASETPEVLASRICASRQFMGISPEELLDRYHYFMATFGPAPDKYKASVITKLAESWGFEKASKAVHAGEFGRTRLLVSMIAKVTKTYHAGQKALVKRHRNATRTLSNNPETMSEAVKSIHMADVGSFSDGRYYN